MAKVLIVDDEAAIRKLLKMTLTAEGHRVIEAGNGIDAVSAIVNERPELVILDVMMPKLDGWGVLEALTKMDLGFKTRVVMLTACTTEVDIARGFKLGASEYMTKPFDPIDVADAAESALTKTEDELDSLRRRELHRARFLSLIEASFGDLER